MALFVFFAGAAEARVVPTEFLASATGSIAVCLSRCGADGASLREFALLFLLEFALKRVDPPVDLIADPLDQTLGHG